MLGTAWHASHGEHSFWQGADELCDHLSQSDHGIVALDESGALLGAILLSSTREQDRNDMLRMHWIQQRTRIAAMAAALGIEARADVALLNEENDLLRRAATELGSTGVAEVVLLMVSPESRGKGVGRALWEKGTAWLRDRGATSVRLVTDDECDWQFYEHLGLSRVMQAASQSYRGLGIYIYQS
jgi:GNAT superfamily N-acetyltransferase